MRGASRLPICLQLQENWSKVGHAASVSVSVFLRDLYLLTVVGQIVRPSPYTNGKCRGISTLFVRYTVNSPSAYYENFKCCY